MKINFNGKKIEVPDVKKCNWLQQIIGLMFCRRKKANALLFKFDKPSGMAIHSFFVFFPFYAVWLDEKTNVLEIKKIKPFLPRISAKNPYFFLLEIPINEKYKQMKNCLSPTGFPKDLNR